MATKKTSTGAKGGSTRAAKSTADAKASTGSAKKKAANKSDRGDSGAHSRTSTDHDEIRKWAEARGAQPACVKGTGDKGDIGVLRLDFPGYAEENLQRIGWDEFFEKFDERGLALVYQEKTAGGAVSNFNKLISRDSSANEKPKTRTAR